jgi:hypothetical protein
MMRYGLYAILAAIIVRVIADHSIDDYEQYRIRKMNENLPAYRSTVGAGVELRPVFGRVKGSFGPHVVPKAFGIDIGVAGDGVPAGEHIALQGERPVVGAMLANEITSGQTEDGGEEGKSDFHSWEMLLQNTNQRNSPIT